MIYTAIFIFVCYLTSLFLVKAETVNVWIPFTLWFLSILAYPGYYVAKKAASKPAKLKQIVSLSVFENRKALLFGAMAITVLFLNFIFIKQYPFVAIGDEVRDGGLNSRQIADGTIKNIHTYGTYESHGLIIPTLVAPWVFVFSGSVLTYRIPAAIVSSLGVFFVYLLALKLGKSRYAFIASLLMATLPLQLFYARTEIVIAFSGFFTSLILLLLYLLVEHNRPERYIFLGTALGFAAGFHASVRTVVIAALIVTLVTVFARLLKRTGRKTAFWGGLSVLVFFFVGFGPRVLYTTPAAFFHARSVSILKEPGAEWGDTKWSAANFAANFNTFREKYAISLKGYWAAPVNGEFHFQDPRPILSLPVFIFGIIGVVALCLESISSGSLKKSFRQKKLVFLLIVVSWAFLFPATNSAITDCVNCDNRLVPLLPISALLGGYGGLKLCFWGGEITKKKSIEAVILASFVIFFIYQGWKFFNLEMASKGKTDQEYLLMHTVYLIKDKVDNQQVCMAMSASNIDFFNLMHVREHLEYFLPGINIRKEIETTAEDNEIYLSADCKTNQKSLYLTQLCPTNKHFICPVNDKELKIYIDNKFLN